MSSNSVQPNGFFSSILTMSLRRQHEYYYRCSLSGRFANTTSAVDRRRVASAFSIYGIRGDADQQATEAIRAIDTILSFLQTGGYLYDGHPVSSENDLDYGWEGGMHDNVEACRRFDDQMWTDHKT
ncbi:hypothetical protein HDU76_003345 [Blyttiomyces sp. JEL0837]|nr:hypothetical protein HDU76_003345 [Blyttiomyces sp. JEL0837]